MQFALFEHHVGLAAYSPQLTAALSSHQHFPQAQNKSNKCHPYKSSQTSENSLMFHGKMEFQPVALSGIPDSGLQRIVVNMDSKKSEPFIEAQCRNGGNETSGT